MVAEAETRIAGPVAVAVRPYEDIITGIWQKLGKSPRCSIIAKDGATEIPLTPGLDTRISTLFKPAVTGRDANRTYVLSCMTGAMMEPFEMYIRLLQLNPFFSTPIGQAYIDSLYSIAGAYKVDVPEESRESQLHHAISALEKNLIKIRRTELSDPTQRPGANDEGHSPEVASIMERLGKFFMMARLSADELRAMDSDKWKALQPDDAANTARNFLAASVDALVLADLRQSRVDDGRQSGARVSKTSKPGIV